MPWSQALLLEDEGFRDASQVSTLVLLPQGSSHDSGHRNAHLLVEHKVRENSRSEHISSARPVKAPLMLF